MNSSVEHDRRSLFSQKSIRIGRCVKHRVLRRFTSMNFSKTILGTNGSAFSEITRTKPLPLTIDGGTIPPAPLIPSDFCTYPSSDTLKSSEFSQAILNLSNKKSTTSNNILTTKTRRRTPVTPELLALTKLRRSEHVTSSIAQRIEELKQAASMAHGKYRQQDVSSTKDEQLIINCNFSDTLQQRQWLHEQVQMERPIEIVNAKEYVQLNHRTFTIRSIEFVNTNHVRFYAQETSSISHFFHVFIKQFNLVTILIISMLRFLEHTLVNVSIPGLQLFLNILYIFILTTVAVILLTNQK